MTVSDQLNDGEVCYTMSFDSPDAGKTYSIFYITDPILLTGERRDIVSSDPYIHGVAGDYDWYYRDKRTDDCVSPGVNSSFHLNSHIPSRRTGA